MNSTIGKVILATALMIGVSLAGPNKAAELFVDCGVSTTNIDSVGICQKDSTISVGVILHNAKKLYDFQVYVSYDTAKLKYVSSIKGNDARPNFLEANGGSIFYSVKRSRDDSTKILLGGSLTSDDGSQCVDGDGCLGIVTFRKLTTDTTKLRLFGVIVEDCSLIADTSCPLHEAAIYPGASAIINKKANAVIANKIEYKNGEVRLCLRGDKADCKAILYDISGHEIRHFEGTSQTKTASLKSVAAGMYFVSIMQGQKTVSYPIIVRK